MRNIFLFALFFANSFFTLNVAIAWEPPEIVCPPDSTEVTEFDGIETYLTFCICPDGNKYAKGSLTVCPPRSGCNPDERATMDPDVAAAFAQVCDSGTFGGSQMEQIDKALGETLDTLEQLEEDAANFVPTVTVDTDALLNRMKPEPTDFTATTYTGTSGISLPANPVFPAVPGYVPPFYDPNEPCSLPPSVRADAEEATDCSVFAQGPARTYCVELAAGSEPLDCTGYSPPTPEECLAMGLYVDGDQCICDNLSTEEVEPCMAFSSCAKTRTWLTPAGDCVGNCAEAHPLLIEAPGFYCECVDDPNTSGVETCTEPKGEPGDVCPTDPDQFIQDDGFLCGCNNPTTTVNECLPILGNPGDVCVIPSGGGGGGGGGCFAAATDIMLEDGTTKKIVDIQVGDRVMSYDKEAGPRAKLLGNRVTHVFDMGEKDVYEIGGARVTDTHKFMTGQGKMLSLKEMKPEDTIVLIDGKTLIRGELKRVGREKVYNFTVENAHSYIANNMRTGNMTVFPQIPEGRYTESDLMKRVVQNQKN